MIKKIIAWMLIIATTATVTVGGTLAYLTDRDSEANVFTTGDVDISLEEKFEQESELLPGQKIEKDVQIKNEGPNDAYVWYTYAVPQGLEAGLNLEFTENTNWSAGELIGTKEVDGVTYNVYASKYSTAIAAGETTAVGLTSVTMDPAVDITPEGDAYLIVAGQPTDLEWNINDTENPVIFINAYAMQTEGFASVDEAYDAFATQWGDMIGAGTYELAPDADAWDGTADTSWYNDEDTEFVITTAEQLAGLAELVDGGNTFAGKTLKLGQDIDLALLNDAGELVPFDPIGSYRNEKAFNGTFDGQGHTISNLSQNTWGLDNGYYYGDLGLGLFACVEDATIKNLTIDGASISGESALCGAVAATAYGDCTFENITVKNSEINDYQYYAGGMVGWASGNHQYINCNVDATTTVGSQWGDFGNANGGIIGGIGSTTVIKLKDCTVACRIDATNDIVSAYQWYNYRNSGMLIGRVPQTITSGEVQTVATPSNVTCENVTVIYGDWANYTYCEFAGTGYPYVRVQAGVSVGAYSNVRYGHPTDANGNTVVDDNHVHNEGEAHQEMIAFDQLFGGPADHRYCYYGINAFDGVNVVYNNK